ncbi:hypothetical protein SmJEL517_g01653 [Synchytrium microbalum]|uniref:RING-type domain-containing protein n=1 Tax=Synchytrium microbalum TaxID=1806994 RepID=A0A507CAG5_9FUNG|nr:uncharacterized protein SmJEL517_g01653 [Synchytrium microbalum]TPX36159.1 hypothetical protein SmJEL517_g01653 [Synchytrium microbalum]
MVLSSPSPLFKFNTLDIFCCDCAQCFNRALVCPACETSLTQADDIVFTDLNPTEDYKSSVLAGLRPELIMEIAGRALSFWAYQMTQETCFQEMMYKQLDEKYTALERQVHAIVREANHEITGLREKVVSKLDLIDHGRLNYQNSGTNHFFTLTDLQKDFELEKHRNHELADNYAEKGKQLQKLQQMYEKTKRRALLQTTTLQQQSGGGVIHDMEMLENHLMTDTNVGVGLMHMNMNPMQQQQSSNGPLHHQAPHPPLSRSNMGLGSSNGGRRPGYNTGQPPLSRQQHTNQQQPPLLPMMPGMPGYQRSPSPTNGTPKFTNQPPTLPNTFQSNNNRQRQPFSMQNGRAGTSSRWSPNMNQ